MNEGDRSNEGAEPSARYDAIIVGAGIAGISLASALARQGLRVLLIAARASHPREFRAEKFSEREMEQFDRFGLGAAARRVSTPLGTVAVGQWGRMAGLEEISEYSVDYPDLVDALRAALPPGVDVVNGRVETLTAGPDLQRVVLADGRSREGRLLVLATGLGDAIRRKLGIDPITVSADHCLVYGFEIETTSWDARWDSVTWRNERIDDGIAYLTLFRRAGAIRANLFTHWIAGEREDEAFRRDPGAALRALLPGLSGWLEPFRVEGAVQRRPAELSAVDNHLRDGVVLVGDAFCTTCPTTGTGVGKALNDVRHLTAHVGRWLETPGMAREKIAQFYDDEAKKGWDEAAIAASVERRNRVMAPNRIWRMRRLRSFVYQRLRQEVREKAAMIAAALQASAALL